MDLQGVSKNLAELNHQRNQEWVADHNGGVKQAVLAFKGDVYQGLEAEKWTESDMTFAEQNLAILSGLYGVLRPNDVIKPYRLEMGTNLNVARKKNLYAYWKKDIQNLFKEEFGHEQQVVNLASKEYFKALSSAEIKNPVLNVDFKDKSKGSYKIISFFAKKARGLMANYIVQNRISEKGELKDFNLANYYFDTKSSTEDHFIFLRDSQ